MKIFVMIEPNYKNSYWCRQTVNGILKEINKKRYELCVLNDIDDNFTQMNKLSRKILIVIGVSVTWTSKLLNILSEQKIHAILINYQPPVTCTNVSLILINYVIATQECLRYLMHIGKSRIALYGINPNASTDLQKKACYEAMSSKTSFKKPSQHIYYNSGSLKDCHASFCEFKNQYDAVICVNDIVAVSLIKYLTKINIDIPKDLFIVSYGDIMISKIITPAITTVTLDFFELGRQSVSIYAYLSKQPSEISVSIKVPCKMLIRESTMKINVNCNKTSEHANVGSGNAVIFYDDKEVIDIMKVENLLNYCDISDVKILQGLINGTSYSKMAERLDISENAIKYRIKHMINSAGFVSRQELIELCIYYFNSAENLQKLNCDHLHRWYSTFVQPNP